MPRLATRQVSSASVAAMAWSVRRNRCEYACRVTSQFAWLSNWASWSDSRIAAFFGVQWNFSAGSSLATGSVASQRQRVEASLASWGRSGRLLAEIAAGSLSR